MGTPPIKNTNIYIYKVYMCTRQSLPHFTSGQLKKKEKHCYFASYAFKREWKVPMNPN